MTEHAIHASIDFCYNEFRPISSKCATLFQIVITTITTGAGKRSHIRIYWNGICNEMWRKSVRNWGLNNFFFGTPLKIVIFCGTVWNIISGRILTVIDNRQKCHAFVCNAYEKRIVFIVVAWFLFFLKRCWCITDAFQSEITVFERNRVGLYINAEH